jgi:hypothetical protein
MSISGDLASSTEEGDFSSAGFGRWGLVLAKSKFHTLKPVLLAFAPFEWIVL